MRAYSNKITLSKNSRGVWGLDTSIGCYSGMKDNPKGCYSECYAARYSKKYGYDFSKTVLREFENERHKHRVVKEISKIDMPFFRIGVSGDPSENWEHTVNIIEDIQRDYQLSLFPVKKKEIVIITKHWNNLTVNQLKILQKYNVCINTSVSALDNLNLLENRIKQYERIKPFCKSVLRIVSCDFNKNNTIGNRLNKLQLKLFDNTNTIDTIFRCYKKNEYVTNEIIRIKEVKFLGKKCHVSKMKKNTFFGSCKNCIEKCGTMYKKPYG